MTYLLSNSQMAALQKVAMRGMKTPITIMRRTTADTAYGDDEEVTFPVVGTTKGWFFSRPTPVQEDDAGSLVTVNTYRLFVPVGTDVRPGDRISVDSTTFVVSDTTAESTWLPLLNVSLRRKE